MLDADLSSVSRVMHQVRTYDVIPVSPSMGLMAFVANTRQLMGAIASVVDKAQISASESAYQR